MASFLAPCILGVASIVSVSCKMTTEGIVSRSEDVSPPVITSFSQVDHDFLLLDFSEEVRLSNLEVRSGAHTTMGSLVLGEYQLKTELLPCADDGESWPQNDGGVSVSVNFGADHQLEAGETYILSGIAHDQEGNSLLFQLPFHGFNQHVAGVVLSEVRTEASNTAKANAKIEFVELYVHTSGNLAGISLYNASDDKFGEYVFPSAEVTAGEYIVVHFRTMEEHAVGCLDETSDDLNVSTAPDSCDDVRDFWVPGTAARLGKSDVILLRERSGGKIVDALLYAEAGIKDSTQKKLVDAAQLAVKAGVWQGSDDGVTWVVSDGLTTTRTLSRQNLATIGLEADPGTGSLVAGEDDWFVVATSSATPGQANSTERHEE